MVVRRPWFFCLWVVGYQAGHIFAWQEEPCLLFDPNCNLGRDWRSRKFPRMSRWHAHMMESSNSKRQGFMMFILRGLNSPF